MSYNKERYRTLKNIAYYILFGVWYVVAHLPLWFLHGISSIAAALLYHVVRYRRKVVRENLQTSFPEMTEQELIDTEKKFYTHFCDILVESVKYFAISKKEMKRRLRFKGIELFEESCRNGRSCGLFLGHYANWEWISSMPLWLSSEIGLCTQLYHPLENYVTDQLVLYTRKRFGGINVPADKSIKHLIQYRNMGKPILVGFIADQAPFWDNIYFWSDFLHHETPWFTGAERIMQKMDMDVYYLDVRRIKRGYYEVEVKLITKNPKDCDQFWLTQQYSDMLQETIRRDPPYWLWSHKRWKRTKEEWLKITNGGLSLKK